MSLNATFNPQHSYPVLPQRLRAPTPDTNCTNSTLLIPSKKMFATGNRLIMVFSEDRHVVSPKRLLIGLDGTLCQGHFMEQQLPEHLNRCLGEKHDVNITHSVTKVSIKTASETL